MASTLCQTVPAVLAESKSRGITNPRSYVKVFLFAYVSSLKPGNEETGGHLQRSEASGNARYSNVSLRIPLGATWKQRFTTDSMGSCEVEPVELTTK